MDCRLRAQLSQNEKAALRRIAAGEDIDQVPLGHLTQLSALWLIESRDGKWELTDYGKTRVAAYRSSGSTCFRSYHG